ncbi:hypothetical protein [Nocardioides luteus]|uniref:Uncharacterized protein n=1 Tax=Nocardioides luteus TaxID=1844 RepID=A0A1J4N1A5_9ACTN|nr:hypothetical protein [Nocardioides luteus]OIJ25372.1 hypothetical protein UG56_018360 [Nocardioides luteus]
MTVATAALVSGCSVGAPPTDFAIEDAVLAMRVQEGGEDSSYLVLVSPEGKTRAIELDEVEGAGISWTEHGITTSDPKHDYVIDESGLTDHKRTSGDESLETSHEWYRVPVGTGTLVGFSPADSSKDPFVTYIDGESGKTTTRVSPYGQTSTAAVCGERVFAPGRGTGTKAFEEDSDSIPEDQWDRAALTSAYPHDGTDILSTLEPTGPGVTSPCVDGIVYEGWENDDHQDFVRTWNTAKGTPAAKAAVDHEIVYPKDASSQIGAPAAVTVVDDQLVWVVENTMWSAPLPTPEAGPVTAREVGYLEGYVGLDAEVLAYSSNAAYTVTNDTELHKRFTKRRSDRVWTELTELSLVRTDIATGKPSLALDIDVEDVDFPTKDAYVTALAINPEWLAKKGE